MLKYFYNGRGGGEKNEQNENYQTLNNFMRNGFQVDIKVAKSPRPNDESEKEVKDYEGIEALEKKIDEIN